MIKSYKGTTALITGASAGIGKAIAYELAREGADLVLTSRNLQKLEQVADDLQKKFKIRAWIFSADLSRKENREELLRFSEKSGIIVDVLVNNAGFGHYGSFQEHSLEVLDSMRRPRRSW